MRKIVAPHLEQGRINDGLYRSPAGEMYGAFIIDGPAGKRLKILSSGPDSEFKWEHVSVSTKTRAPNWTEMCFVKDLFWHDEEVVMQLHPARSDYVNCHPYCLHLWRPMEDDIPLPPSLLVGPKETKP